MASCTAQNNERTFGFRLHILLGCVLLCLAVPAGAQIKLIQCRFSTKPAGIGAKIEASLVGANWIRIQPGSATRLIEGNWLFNVTAPGYTSIRHRRINVSTRSPLFAHTFELTPKPASSRVATRKSSTQNGPDKQVSDGKQIRASRGEHKGETGTGHLANAELKPGENKVIPLIQVPNIPARLTFGTLDPSEARFTVTGDAKIEGNPERGATVKVSPQAGKATASVVVSATAPNCKPWSSEKYELGWKQKEPIKVPDVRLAYGTLKVTADPQFADVIKVELIDGKQSARVIPLSQDQRVVPGKYTIKATNIPTDYEQQEADKVIEIKDHIPAEPVKVVIAPAFGYVWLSGLPPGAKTEVLDGNQPAERKADGTYRLALGDHTLTVKAKDYEDKSLPITVKGEGIQPVPVSLTKQASQVIPPSSNKDGSASGTQAQADSQTSESKREMVAFTLMIKLDGKALQDANIEITGADGVSIEKKKSDDQGNRAFSLAADTYEYSITYALGGKTYQFCLWPTLLQVKPDMPSSIRCDLWLEQALVCDAAAPLYGRDSAKKGKSPQERYQIAYDLLTTRPWSGMVSSDVRRSEDYLGNSEVSWDTLRLTLRNAISPLKSVVGQGQAKSK